jgi:hypothetical protein
MEKLIDDMYLKINGIARDIFHTGIFIVQNVDIHMRLDGTCSLIVCVPSESEGVIRRIKKLYRRIVDLFTEAGFTEDREHTGFSITKRHVSGRQILSLNTNFFKYRSKA